jgi:hypothetical protein
MTLPRPPDAAIRDAFETITDVKHLLELGSMAAGPDLEDSQSDAFQILFAICDEKLDSARSLINAQINAAQLARAGAQPVDPVFAAIASHDAALAVWRAAEAKADKVMAKQERRKVPKADTAAATAAYDREQAAAVAFLQNTPKTMAGLRASIQHMVNLNGGNMCESTESFFIMRLLDSPLFAEGQANV